MNTALVSNGQIKNQIQMNKIEAIVILVGLGLTIIGIAIHLIRATNRSKKESQKPIESISAIKGGESIQYPSSTTIKMKGSLESSKPSEVAMRVAKNSTYGAYGPTGITGPVGSTASFAKAEQTRIKEKYKKKEVKFVDHINEDDKKLVRQASNDGDFFTSMLVAQATDSAILGTVIGGDPVGAIIGDMLNDSDSDSKHSLFDNSSNNDYDYDSSSSSYDYGSSSDSSSSWDSGSSFDSFSSDW